MMETRQCYYYVYYLIFPAYTIMILVHQRSASCRRSLLRIASALRSQPSASVSNVQLRVQLRRISRPGDAYLTFHEVGMNIEMSKVFRGPATVCWQLPISRYLVIVA